MGFISGRMKWVDLIMPGMGGKRCLEELLKLNARVKVLIASGYSNTMPVKDTIERGARDFLSKPYKAKEILEVVRKILDED